MSEEVLKPPMEAPANNFFGDIMPAHFDPAGHARERKPDIGNPKEEEMDTISLFSQVF